MTLFVAVRGCLITGAHGFQRDVGFAMNEEAGIITQLVRATLDE